LSFTTSSGIAERGFQQSQVFCLSSFHSSDFIREVLLQVFHINPHYNLANSTFRQPKSPKSYSLSCQQSLDYTLIATHFLSTNLIENTAECFLHKIRLSCSL
jgi:hypothetical protein